MAFLKNGSKIENFGHFWGQQLSNAVELLVSTTAATTGATPVASSQRAAKNL